MTDKPRKHHFVPQFWIRCFAGADGKLWAYDHYTGRISERSSKQLMQIFNLYTVQPLDADDTTLETVDLNRIDSEGSSIFDRILKGDHSQSAKERFILGDTGVLYNQGDMQSLSVHLSPGAALYLTPSDRPQPTISSVTAADHDVTNLNLESAASSRRWIVGERAEFGQLRSQVGSSLLPNPRKT